MPPERSDRGRSVDEDPPRADRKRKAIDHVVVGRVHGRGVAQAAVLGDQLARPDPVLDRRGAHDPEHRHQLLGDERMRGEGVEVGRQRGEQHLVGVRRLEAGQAAEVDARLPENVELHLALVGERARRQRVRLLVGQQPGAHPLELLDHLIVDLHRRSRTSAPRGRSPRSRTSWRSGCPMTAIRMSALRCT